MRQVEFQEVGMENYGPYIDPMILKFVNDSLVLITGPNGIGKTMALDSIPFTLYGVTSKGAKGDDVVNNVVGRNCKTWIKFHIDNTPYIVTRYHKYTKYGNTVILNVNGIDTKKGQKEVLPEIERVLCPRKTFMNTLMFGQKIKDFFTDLGDADKKEIFRKILALEQYLTYYKKADEKLKSSNDDLDTINTEISVQTGLLKNSIEEIEIWEQQRDHFEVDKKRRISELSQDLQTNNSIFQRWENELGKIEKDDPDTTQIIKEMIEGQTKMENLVDRKNVELRELSSNRDLKKSDMSSKAQLEKNEIISEYRDALDDLEYQDQAIKDQQNEFVQITQEKRHAIELTIQKLQSENSMCVEQAFEINEKVIKADRKQCPLCDQDVDEETIKHLVKTIKILEKKVETNNSSIKDMTYNIKRFNKILATQSTTFNEQREHIQTKFDILEKDEEVRLYQVDERLQEAGEKIQKVVESGIKLIDEKFKEEEHSMRNMLQVLQLQKDKMERLQKEIDEVNEKMKTIYDRIGQLQAQIEAKENEEYDETQLEFHRSKKLQIGSKLNYLKEERVKTLGLVEAQQFWKTGYSSSGIPSMLIDDSIPFMNERVALYLDKLTNGRYVVSFDTLAATKAGEFRDKISVNVLDTFTRANSRVQLSGGQTRIIDIATILTLGDLQSNIQHIKINILIFDEIFDSLDEENINYVSKVLNKLKFGRSIYLISHRHEDQLEADEVLAMA